MKINIEAEALKYAIKIQNKEYNYNIVNARVIFGRYFYLVEQFNKELIYTKQRQQTMNLQIEINSINKYNELIASIKKPLYNEVITETRIESAITNIENEMSFAEDEAELYDLYTKWERLKTAQLNQKIKILNTLKSPLADKYAKEWADLKVYNQRTNIIAAQIARLTDINLYANSKKIDSLKAEYNERRRIYFDDKAMLELEIDNTIHDRFKELKNGRK